MLKSSKRVISFLLFPIPSYSYGKCSAQKPKGNRAHVVNYEGWENFFLDAKKG